MEPDRALFNITPAGGVGPGTDFVLSDFMDVPYGMVTTGADGRTIVSVNGKSYRDWMKNTRVPEDPNALA